MLYRSFHSIGNNRDTAEDRKQEAQELVLRFLGQTIVLPRFSQVLDNALHHSRCEELAALTIPHPLDVLPQGYTLLNPRHQVTTRHRLVDGIGEIKLGKFQLAIHSLRDVIGVLSLGEARDR